MPTAPSIRPASTFDDVLAAAGGADVLAVPAGTSPGEIGPQPRGVAAEAALAYRASIDVLARGCGFAGSGGEHISIAAPDAALPRLEVVGVGAARLPDFRAAGRFLGGLPVRKVVTTIGDVADASAQQAFVEGFFAGTYRTPRGIGRPPAQTAPELELLGAFDADAVHRGHIVARASLLERRLADTPAGELTPEAFAREAERLATAEGLTVRRWDAGQLAEAGFGAIAAVGSGSSHRPALVELTYAPSGASRHITLVGKGITFDTGGISLKRGETIHHMKDDMAGAAAVLAAVLAAARLQIAVKVTALLPLAENAIGAASYRPGDVVRCYNGTTVEITNTDAEGRMVLADALAYGAAQEPDVIADIATLTGAARTALGTDMAALYATDDVVASRMARAGEAAGEPVWRMPLVSDYRRMLDSESGDLRHRPPVGTRGVPGSIVAALFLREFTAGVPWVHIDAAGPAGMVDDGGAGRFGAALLTEWLRSEATA